MKYIQLRVARQVLNLGVRDIANVLRVSKAVISKAELGKTRDFFYKYSPALLEFFKSHNIIFPNEYSIRHCINEAFKQDLQPSNSLTRFQLRAGRCIMNLKQYQLSKLIDIDTGVISRAEQLQNTDYIKPQDKSVIIKLHELFLKHNITFPDLVSVVYKKV